MRRTSLPIYLVMALAVAAAAQAAEPPDLVNYQGVLRSSADAPLDGTYDMVFVFWSAATGGSEILLDRHIAADGNAVSVSGGLFNVALGGGTVLDGSGPKIYGSLAEVFRDYATVYLEIHVGKETLTPRVQIVSAGYALNADHVDGRDSTYFLNTSSTAQTKTGPLTVNTPGSAAFAIEARGQEGGGTFWDTDGSGAADVAFGDKGIHAAGNVMGGSFEDRDSSGYARLAWEDVGIDASGNQAGGFFVDDDGTGFAYVGWNDQGIWAEGYTAGGEFRDSNGTGEAWVGYGGTGIEAHGGVVGGYFEDSNGTGRAYVGYGQRGIEAYGSDQGGYFKDTDDSGYAHVGYGHRGIEAYGSGLGGYFEDSNGSGYSNVGIGNYGIQSFGYFTGGYFEDSSDSGHAYVGYGDDGINAFGDSLGGYFEDLDNGTWVRTAWSTSSVWGNGTKNFVQNHPHDPGKVIVYAALEGDEVGTYTRGTGRLVDGRARVSLGETFKWVTNPDVGLTAHVTPRSPGAVLYVESLTTEEMVVRTVGGFAGDARFDYLVVGLRVGFEEACVVREKEHEAYLPAMDSDDALYGKQPALRQYSALERFKGMRETSGEAGELDLSASDALRAAIGRFDAAVHGTQRPRLDETGGHPPGVESYPAAGEGEDPAVFDAQDTGGADAGDARVPTATEEKSPAHTDSAAAPSGARQALTAPMPSTQALEAGDVVVLDAERPGHVARASFAADTAVFGVVSDRTGDAAAKAGEVPVAFAGVVACRVDAAYGPVRAGDLLATSPTPGHAMLTLESTPGTILGKAVDPLEHGTGVIRVLVQPR